jgi:hypothetical protein
MADRPVIIPEMKVFELLESYPELEQPLIDIAPAFSKLKNPVLRKTIGKLTSLRQAAQVGGISLGEMVSTLRQAAGIDGKWNEEETPVCNHDGGNAVGGGHSGARPEWVDGAESVETFDAIEMIEGGGHPLPQVMSAVKNLTSGQAYVLITPFEPAPLIEKAQQAGAETWVEQTGSTRFSTWFRRS